MQFTCDNCKALLQIADEKVRGKRLVVRCKRCGVRIHIADPALGPSSRVEPVLATPRSVSALTPPATPDTDTESTRAMDSDLLARALQASEDAASAATKAPQAGDPAVWFALVSGKQEGPFSRAELGLKSAQGAIGPRTYLWREGMADWLRASDVPDVASFFAAPPQSARPTPSGSARVERSHPGGGVREASGADAVPGAPMRQTPIAEQPVAARHFTPAPGSAAANEGAPKRYPTPFESPYQQVGAENVTPEPAEQPKAEGAEDLARWASAEIDQPNANQPLAGEAQHPQTGGTDAEVVAQPQRRARSSTWMVIGVVIVVLVVALVAAYFFLGREVTRPAAPPHASTGAPGPAKTEPTAAPASPPAALTADVVKRKLDENAPALQSCVDDALKREPTLKVGKINIATTIAPTGQVMNVSIDKKTVDDSPLGNCLKTATRHIMFPPFSGDAFEVDIPIVVSGTE